MESNRGLISVGNSRKYGIVWLVFSVAPMLAVVAIVDVVVGQSLRIQSHSVAVHADAGCSLLFCAACVPFL